MQHSFFSAFGHELRNARILPAPGGQGDSSQRQQFAVHAVMSHCTFRRHFCAISLERPRSAGHRSLFFCGGYPYPGSTERSLGRILELG